MSDAKINCIKCSRNSPRNMHNKCIYCGEPFSEEHHFTKDEKEQKLDTLNQMNEESRKKLKESRARDKQRELEKSPSFYGGSGLS